MGSPIASTTVRMRDGRSLDVYLGGADGGARDTVLYLHGSPGSGIQGAGMAAACAERRLRLVSFSRAGYGSSSRRLGRSVADVVEDATDLLDALEVERAWVLGWSGGGPHALACVAFAPERFPGAALIGGVAPYPAEGLDWFEGMGPENVEEFQATLADPKNSVRSAERDWPKWRDVTGAEVAEVFGGLIDDVDRGSLTGEFSEFVAASSREGLREGYWGWVDDDWAFTGDWGVDLGTIGVPVHVWQGGHDKMVPFGHGAWLSDHIPTACRHLHPEHGHLTLAVDSIGPILDELVSPPAR
jgi:pimeloyl-ACP methyl ester carboxylesterase